MISGCKPRNGAAAATKPAAAPIAIAAAQATEEDVLRHVDGTGTLAPWEEATVSIEADGRLVEVRVDLGTRVGKGAVLARVATEEYEFRKTQAEAELAAAEADFKRVEPLFQKQMASRQQVDEARRRLDVARTGADLARKKLADASLRAPIGGTISRRMVNLGEYVRMGTPAFTVVRTEPLKLKMDVPERYQPDVKVGDVVEARGEALGERVLRGKVVRIGPSVAVDTRAFPVEARFENEGGAVKPGTFVRAVIRTGTRARAITVPDTVVTTFAGNPRVFVIEGGEGSKKARERAITVGGRIRDRVIVAKGLAAGETLAASGIELLSDGAAVTIRDAQAAR